MTITFKQVAINGGGFVTGMDIHADGTMVCRVDVFGAYLNNTSTQPSSWTLLTTTASLPDSIWGFTGANYTGNWLGVADGVFEIRIAPSNSNIFYMMYGGQMYISTNKGTTWTLMTNFAKVNAFANGPPYRTDQKKITIDPNNADVVYVGAPQNGVYVTSNGTAGASATFSLIGAISVGTADGSGWYPGYCGMVFDTSLGTTNGKTNSIYIGARGVGVYHCANAGSVSPTWTLLNTTGMPTSIYDAVTQNGNYCCATPVGIQKWNGSSWSTMASEGSGSTAISINPFNPLWIGVTSNGGGCLDQSGDGGTNWNGPYYFSGLNPNRPPGDAPWLSILKPYGPTTGNFWAVSAIYFDPITPNRLWISWGYGVAYVDLSSSTFPWNTPLEFVPVCAGIQNAVARCAIAPTGQKPILSFEDIQFFTINNPDLISISDFGYGSSANEAAGWSVDWSKSTPGVYAALLIWQNTDENISAFTIDYGAHWTPFPVMPTAMVGGCITCVDANHFIACDSFNHGLVSTANGGKTWTVYPINISSGNYNSSTGLVSLNLASAPAFPISGSPGANNIVKISGLAAIPYSISSGTYNNSTGLVTLNLSPSPSFTNGTYCTVNITGSGTNLASLNGGFYGTVSGSAVTFSVAAGLGTINITGGTVNVVSNLETPFVFSNVSGSTVTYSGSTGLGSLTITGGLVYGSTWSTPTGLPGTGWPNYLWANMQILCNDAAGKVFAYSGGNGLYVSNDKGASFSLVNNKNLLQGSWGSTAYYEPHLSTVPGNAGYLIFDSGVTGNLIGSNTPYPTGQSFWKSIDGGSNWTSIPNVSDVWCHGYGITAGGSYTFPTLWIVGWVNNGSGYKYGIWVSRDLGVSDWTWYIDYPNNLNDPPVCITGDGQDPTKVYIGFGGSSFMYGSTGTYSPPPPWLVHLRYNHI